MEMLSIILAIAALSLHALAAFLVSLALPLDHSFGAVLLAIVHCVSLFFCWDIDGDRFLLPLQHWAVP